MFCIINAKISTNLTYKTIKVPKMKRETVQKFPDAGFFLKSFFWKVLRHVHADPASNKPNWCNLKIYDYIT